jgi:uncharacterized repeat protein (TIGR01451 family)
MRKKTILFILPLALLLALMPLMVSAAGGPWSDDFDSYATGSQLHGQGGWKGWGNDVTFGALASSAEARSAPNSAAIEGLSDLVQEYTASDGQWVYTAWQYIPSTMTGSSYFIMLNQYDDPCITCNWSVQVIFNSVTNMMTDEGQTGNTQAYLEDQWVELRLEIDLDGNTQDFYYNDVLFYSGSWSEHVSTGGITSIGAVDLFANGATVVYYDDMSLLEPVVGEPGLEVSKTPDTQDVTVGGNADFTITITNTGTLTWTDVTATDALVAACDNNFTDMAPGTVETYSCTDVGVTESYTNTVVVVGTITGGPTMTVSDDAVVNANAPTSVSLSSLGGDDSGVSMIWVIATTGVGLAAGFFVLSRRRRQQQI